MSRSTSFDRTARLEIGWYELASEGSRPTFLTIGVIDTSLNWLGKQPVASERLKSSVTNGAITSRICFSTNIGKGSAAELLSGSWRTPLMMSSTESDENSRSDGPGGARVYVGGGTLSVDVRTLVTLSAENLLTVSTSMDGAIEVRPRPSSWSTDRQSLAGLDRLHPKVSALLVSQLPISPSLVIPHSTSCSYGVRTSVKVWDGRCGTADSFDVVVSWRPVKLDCKYSKLHVVHNLLTMTEL